MKSTESERSGWARRELLAGAFALAAAPRAALAVDQEGAQEPAPKATEPAARHAVRVVLVRHAEKGADPAQDPELSEAGRARAETLARMLAKAGVTHLYSSQFKRATQTLEPLARRTGLEISVQRAQETVRVAELVRALPDGSLAVVAGHSNTVPVIAKALGAELGELGPDGNLPDADYDRFCAITLAPAADGSMRALGTFELRY